MKTVTAFVLFFAAIATGTATAMAQSVTLAGTAEKKTSSGKGKTSAADKKRKEPDIAGMDETKFNCELGNKLIIYSQADDDQHIALRWKKRLHRMTRVSTTTGAHRFENAQVGLVWIGIPAKGMLLDSKKGRQLANECKSTAQREVGEQRF